ncbi:hypothetical protein GCM10023093_15050 [Nemorincola caseinilytica]|uniref:Lipocalin-like domain-containing protein n=1 Tax=Nemorincola caseinilytica TaxID=2054315 RepID=A0ABP8NEP3_9BACT
MRITTIWLMAALSVMMTISCRKTTTEPGTSTSIRGKWKLVRITGGIAGLDMTADEWGHSQSYEFASGSRCYYTFDGNITTTTYTLFTGPS